MRTATLKYDQPTFLGASVDLRNTDFIIPEPHLRQQFLPIGKNAGKED